MLNTVTKAAGQLAGATQGAARRILCKVTDRFHQTYESGEGKMGCLYCRARWTQVIHEPDSWLRVSDGPSPRKNTSEVRS
jgi:hypothetical protein